jgi:hypothetical protein
MAGISSSLINFYNFFIIINQQSECTFYKLMVWLFLCLGEESSSGESSVPYVRSIGQFLFSRLPSSLADSALMSGFSWVTVLVWCLLR